MTALSASLLVALAGLLLISASAKAVNPAAATQAAGDLGLARSFARLAVLAITICEGAIAGWLLLRLQSSIAAWACLTLFAVFAVAGAAALVNGRRIECGCLGAIHRSRLGWNQLAQLVAVAASLAFAREYPPEWDARTGGAIFFATCTAVAGLLLAFSAPKWRRVRCMRTSLASAASVGHAAMAELQRDLEDTAR